MADAAFEAFGRFHAADPIARLLEEWEEDDAELRALRCADEEQNETTDQQDRDWKFAHTALL